jgi:hypothetical protein
MKIFREKGGVISEDPIWVCFSGPYMYTADTLCSCLRSSSRSGKTTAISSGDS